MHNDTRTRWVRKMFLAAVVSWFRKVPTKFDGCLFKDMLILSEVQQTRLSDSFQVEKTCTQSWTCCSLWKFYMDPCKVCNRKYGVHEGSFQTKFQCLFVCVPCSHGGCSVYMAFNLFWGCYDAHIQDICMEQSDSVEHCRHGVPSSR